MNNRQKLQALSTREFAEWLSKIIRERKGGLGLPSIGEITGQYIPDGDINKIEDWLNYAGEGDGELYTIYVCGSDKDAHYPV